jgi:hypothetical protein
MSTIIRQVIYFLIAFHSLHINLTKKVEQHYHMDGTQLIIILTLILIYI